MMAKQIQDIQTAATQLEKILAQKDSIIKQYEQITINLAGLINKLPTGEKRNQIGLTPIIGQWAGSYQDEIVAMGYEQVIDVSGHLMYDDSAGGLFPEEVFRENLQAFVPNGFIGQIILDIEGDTYNAVGDGDADALVAMLQRLEWTKEMFPLCEVGLYANLPRFNGYDIPDWEQKCENFKPVMEKCDVLVPSLYAFHPDSGNNGNQNIWTRQGFLNTVLKGRELFPHKNQTAFCMPWLHEAGTGGIMDKVDWQAQFRFICDLDINMACIWMQAPKLVSTYDWVKWAAEAALVDSTY